MDSLQSFHVGRRYQPLKIIGEGAQSIVCCLKDLKKNNRKVVMKLSRVENTDSALRVLREIKALRIVGSHPKIVKLSKVIVKEVDHFNWMEVYLVMNYVRTDLGKIINSKNIQLSEKHCSLVMYQLLLSLHYIHSARLVHLDIKPSNVLLSGKLEVQICDFGETRSFDAEPELVGTVGYTAPEVIMGRFSTASDVWSAGCVAAEMCIRDKLFPATNYVEQMYMMMELDEDDIESLMLSDDDSVLQQCQSIGRVEAALSGASEECTDFITQLLCMYPGDRPSVREALQHRFLWDHFDEKDLVECEVVADASYEKLCRTWHSARTEVLHETQRAAPAAEGVQIRPHSLPTSLLVDGNDS